MLQLRTWNSLGGGDHDWLKARHHFAIDSQGNSAHARLGGLVVWNDDEIAPLAGFPMHAHRDMEIVTYVREGVLQHVQRQQCPAAAFSDLAIAPSARHRSPLGNQILCRGAARWTPRATCERISRRRGYVADRCRCPGTRRNR
jgi:pirin-like protein